MIRKTIRPIQRTMLVFPPMFNVSHVDTMFCPPLGIAYLGAYVRDIVEVRLLDALVEGEGHRTPITDKMDLAGLSYDDILARIREFQPDLVGFSCVFSNQFASIRELARRVKAEIDPAIVLVAGGTHPSFLPERTLETTDLDYVVTGEGELTFRALIEAHNRGRGVQDIDGLAYRDNGRIVVNPRVNYVEDLDELPFPARDLLPMEKYFRLNVPMGLHWRKRRNTPIVTSRGCPCHCTFCSSTIHWGNRYRFRSPANVLAEIQHLKDTFNVQELKFQDDNLTMPRARAKQIFEGMAERGLAMPWNTPNGVAVWTLDDELIRLMKQSGCFEFTLAIESGDQWVLDHIVKKPLQLDKPVEVAKLARKHGITTVGYFIIGFPGETLAQIKTTIRFAHSLNLDYFIPFIYNPLPGSPLWKVCVDEGYIPEDYHYEDANNYFQSDLNTTEFDSQTLARIQARAYLRMIITMPLRNPREFVSYYGRMILTRPNFLRTFFRHVFKVRE
jgi:anaerobic magnesium-protoporphyrin IX monomethyl ester cyclase